MALQQLNHPPEPSQRWACFGDIGVYGISLPGSAHRAGGIPCQDRNGFYYLEPEGILIAAVADGVGSCGMSHWGAAAAVSASLAALSKQLRALSGGGPFALSRLSREETEKLFDNAFRYARKRIGRLAREQGCDRSAYQTTLTAAAYDGSSLACCHAGDGGIVAQGVSGSYRMITRRHTGEEASSVIPLQAGRWQVTIISTQITGFLMATDGVLDHFVSGRALGERVYYPFFEERIYGMTPRQGSGQEPAVEQTFDKTLEQLCSEAFSREVTDDITILAAASGKRLLSGIHPDFSREEWEEQSRRFQEEKNRRLYPGQPVKHSRAADSLSASAPADACVTREKKTKEEIT